MDDNNKYFGKYRGVVLDNNDPQKRGRIKALVPDVLGEVESGWAMPCAPFGGEKVGFFAIPAVNAGVWIEFECGDPDFPVWSGCWWGSDKEIPPQQEKEPHKKVMIRTPGGQSIILDDTEESITLETVGGQKIVLRDNGIEIDNGKGATIKLSDKKVSVNGDALEVQ